MSLDKKLARFGIKAKAEPAKPTPAPVEEPRPEPRDVPVTVRGSGPVGPGAIIAKPTPAAPSVAKPTATRAVPLEGTIMETDEPIYQNLYWVCGCCGTDWINIADKTCPTPDCRGIAPRPRIRQ